MNFDRKDLTTQQLIDMYRALLLPRLIEEKMLLLLRQGRISKWFSGIGQEAISVGATLALENDEWIMPLHRNLGVFTTRRLDLKKLFLQWQGHVDGYSKGRERSFHFGVADKFICGMISHLGPQLAIACGTALASVLDGTPKVSLAFTGEGGTSEGDFHEALNLASVWNLPVIFIIENNGYALSSPISEQYRCENLVDRARGYGMEGVKIDGNNILTVYDTVKGVRDYCLRNQRPYLIECSTFRMRGHEEASGVKYVPAELFEQWSPKDPLISFQSFLANEEMISEEIMQEIKAEVKAEIDEAVNAGLAESTNGFAVSVQDELNDIYAKQAQTKEPQHIQSAEHFPGQPGEFPTEQGAASKNIRFVDAITQALDQSLERYPQLVLMGQDIAAYGGAFKVTEGLFEKYGKERVRNTPLCESGVIGIALGLSLAGRSSVVEMQFADFVTAGFNQVVNNLAKIHYRWGATANVVIRMPTGAGVGAGPFHSQSTEAWFFHTPGLKIVYPSNAADAKGLLNAAIADPGPVLYFEHKALYRSISGEVPDEWYETAIGKAEVLRKGTDATIITYGAGVHWATDHANANSDQDLYILDLKTLAPLDYSAIEQAVAATGKVLVLHEDTLTGGIGAEIAAWISEHCFENLDAPVRRCASLDTPVPFNRALEQQFLASSRLGEVMDTLLRY